MIIAIVCAIVVTIVIQQFISLIQDAEAIVETVYQYINSKNYIEEKDNSNTVYVICDKKNSNEVVYVGRTSRFFKRRYSHQDYARPEYNRTVRFPREKYVMIIVANDLTLKESRALEEMLIVAFTFDALENVIHSIGEWNYYKFNNEFERMGKLIECGFNPE